MVKFFARTFFLYHFWISQICAVHINTRADSSSQWTQHMVFNSQHKYKRSLYVAGSPLSAGESARIQSIHFIRVMWGLRVDSHELGVCGGLLYIHSWSEKVTVFWQSALHSKSAPRPQLWEPSTKTLPGITDRFLSLERLRDGSDSHRMLKSTLLLLPVPTAKQPVYRAIIAFRKYATMWKHIHGGIWTRLCKFGKNTKCMRSWSTSAAGCWNDSCPKPLV